MEEKENKFDEFAAYEEADKYTLKAVEDLNKRTNRYIGDNNVPELIWQAFYTGYRKAKEVSNGKDN